MSKLIYYHETDNSFKRNIPAFLSKKGIEVCNVNNIYDLDKSVEEFQPQAFLVNNDSDAVLISRTSSLPIIVVMDTVTGTYDNLSFREIKNPVFLRSYNDSLDTILNTAKLATTL